MESVYEPENVGGLYKGKSKESDSFQGLQKKKAKKKESSADSRIWAQWV